MLGGRPKTPKKPLDNPKQTPNVNVDVNEDVNENEDVDVNGKGDCKGKNHAGIVDNLKNGKEDTVLKQSLKQSLKLGFLGEDPPRQASGKGINGIKDKTDFCFGERGGTANDRTSNGRTENGGTEDGKSTARDADSLSAGITTLEGIKSQRDNPPALASMDKNGRESASAEIISSTSANTFKTRVKYAKSLGIEEGVARKICNFAQSKKYPLAEVHYKGFVGKSGKEVEEAFRVLKLVVQRGKETKFQGTKFQNSNGLSPNGLKHINSS